VSSSRKIAAGEDALKVIRSAERVGAHSTVGIIFEQKPVSVLQLDEYRLFDMSPGSVRYLLLIVHWFGY